MKKTSTTHYVILIIIIGILSLFYSTYILNRKIEEYQEYHKTPSLENFENYNYKDHVDVMYNNSLENYKKGLDFNTYSIKTNFHNNIQLYDVRNDYPLITYGCIQTKIDNNIENDINQTFYTKTYEFYAVTINDVYQKIVGDINETLSKVLDDKLDEPVFVLMYQAPYLYFNNEQIIARHDVSNNLKSVYQQNIDNIEIGTRKIFTKLLIIYPIYDSNLKKYDNEEGVIKFHEYFKTKLSRNKLCFLECNKTNYYACGCLNRNKSDNNQDFYKSSCIEYTGEYFNYGMMYSINKYNTLFSRLFTRPSIII